MSKRSLPLVVLTTAGLALAGCGSSSKTSGSSAPSTSATPSAHASAAAATPTPVTGDIKTKAEATAYAAKVNLRASDLPGYTSTAAANNDDDQSGAQVAACAGGVAPNAALADVNSDDFSKDEGQAGTVDISSEVEVLPNADLVAQDYAAITSAKGQKCLSDYIVKEVQSSGPSTGASTTPPAITITPTTIPGTDQAFDAAVSFGAESSGLGAQASLHFYGFTVGQSEITLSTTVIGTATVDKATVDQLLGTLAKRAG